MTLNDHFSKVQEKQWIEGIVQANKYDLTSIASGFAFCLLYLALIIRVNLWTVSFKGSVKRYLLQAEPWLY